MYSAITRPRTAGSVLIWMVALAAVIMVSDASPTGMHAIANVRYVGMSAITPVAIPNANAAPMTSRTRGRSRRAASSAPVSEPIARTEPRIPYSPAPLPNSVRAIMALVSWKLRPNVETTPTTTMITTMSLRPRT